MKEEFEITNYLLASHGQRFINYIIDSIIQYIIIFILGISLGLIALALGENAIVDWMNDMSTVMDYLIGVTISIIYFFFMETYTSRTIAKYITKTMVVMHDGTKPDSGQILKRTLCRMIPFNALSFLGSPCNGWHDTISHTYVVKKDLFNEKVKMFYEFEEIGKEIVD
jgi:uncharacterized RDD family membrane protein YckC